MQMRSVQAIFSMLLCGFPLALAAGQTLPQPLEQITALQKRADNLTFGALGENNYHLAKARTWLDMATSEYHQTDTSGVLPAAITQAETLISALENKQADISTDMPTDFPGCEKVRVDLWEKVAALKNIHSACGQRQLAEGEVQLIWAGHEKIESGWNHAEPYARIAEDSIKAAQTAIDICSGKASATANTAPTPVVEPAPIAPAPVPAPVIAPTPSAQHVIEKMTLSADALFKFDSTRLTRYSRNRLNKLTLDLQQISSLEQVVLVGHTDRLRSDGKHYRNQTLSERRAQRIKQYLISKGVPADKITARGVGSTEPLVQCSNQPGKAEQIVCLQPNRRVEITILGVH